ncbi:MULTISPECIES: hypothetical protein [unclassified Brachybacterium]|uniref:hypothetical protein n=1 Tax=unclassified Brachybacterium TaxID=2623841 RepID=UPI000C7F8272|nr:MULTISPECIES: hypothetical protein [unclassified Brachybacterium]PMC76173.1 hypothetical protein CJ197_03080 [Brachybacterium sp. UMB0905]
MITHLALLPFTLATAMQLLALLALRQGAAETGIAGAQLALPTTAYITGPSPAWPPSASRSQ